MKRLYTKEKLAQKINKNYRFRQCICSKTQLTLRSIKRKGVKNYGRYGKKIL